MVSLVITIVVMLILLGVTVTTSINGGLIGTAKNSNEETRYSQVMEEKEMWELEEKATDRFGIKAETLEELIDRLEKNGLLTAEEANQARTRGFVNIAKKDIYFKGRKVVAEGYLWGYNKLSNNSVTIYKYNGSTDNLTELEIPNVLIIDGEEYSVDKIEGGTNSSAIVNFEGKVIISQGIYEIGRAAFNGANEITDIEIPDSVTIIGDTAFQACTGLTSITIPGSVKKIGSDYKSVNCQTFNRCVNLENVILGEGIEEIGGRVFGACKKVEEWILPKSLKKIGPYAFYDSTVKKFNIPENIESISPTFLSSSNLIEITVDSNNKNFASVDGVLFDKNVTQLVKYPEKKEVATYTIPNTVISINDNAFQGCYKIQNLVISDSIEKIGPLAFESATINTIKIGSRVSNIDEKAFDEAVISTINVESENENYKTINGVLFNQTETTLIKYPNGITNKEYEIPSTVNTIGRYAFFRNGIEKIIIPNSVKTIKCYGFGICQSLGELNLPSGLEKIEDNAFYGNHGIKEVVIPSSVITVGKAFNNMSGLQKITINKTENSISVKPWRASASVIIEWTGE